ncbi:hypothetical protein V3W47_00375 [Deinococcus sp. YIM 134068]|uniref:hypothetical protein n=1 Tax=Deinococcus lichenicola TaxID=3118910 RepID=UPI002F94E09E
MTLRDARMNRQALEVVTLDDQGNELAYWLARTPAERLEALELLRQIHYGYDPLTAQVTRVLDVVEPE